MNVQELIDQLSNLDPNMPVHFTYNYGDHAQTMIAPEVDHVDIEMVKPNSYVNDMAICDDHEQEDEGAIQVVVLGC